MNDWAEGWLTSDGGRPLAVRAVGGVATLIAWLLRRSSPVVRYWLWQIVAIKLLLMPFWTFAIPLPSWAESRPPEQSAAFQPAASPATTWTGRSFRVRLRFRKARHGSGRAARRAVLGTAWPRSPGKRGCCWRGLWSFFGSSFGC